MENRLKRCEEAYDKIRYVDETWGDLLIELPSLNDDNWTEFVRQTREHYEGEDSQFINEFILSVAFLIGRL